MYKDNNKKALHSESYIYQKLIENGISVEWVAFSNRKSKADFITKDGKTIDVKYSNTSTRKNASREEYKVWNFNIHHHGKKQEGIDFYICVFDDGNENYIFIFPSKLALGTHITISTSQIQRGKYDYFQENWDLIKNSE